MWRIITIWFYQQIANLYIRKLNQTDNLNQWKHTYDMAMKFNEFCVKREIYLN